ncbi:uncharacterized protein LOC121274175 [Carcharodon carcharias]|uniref:uncharacterized protein LOC121274175 n=1 Tax=Carcharodon carcharias TaxID=13397 RepID=UPI001B7F3BD9|nr:uncharacterized protein LOC121274175 [Carcharodon carcharias]
MKGQHFKTPWSLQSNPEDENDENFIPFVTRSKTVSRYDAEAGSRLQNPAIVRNWACAMDHVHPLQHAGPHWMELYEEASPRLLSSQTAQRPNVKQDIRCSASGLCLERLPSPRELYGRRKRRRREAGERRVMAVICHLEELKRRQKGIDQLKAQRWGANRSQRLTQDNEELEKINPGQQSTDSTGIADFINNTDLEDRELFFQPRWNFVVEDPHPTPWANPFLSCERAEAEEKQPPASFLMELV